MPCKHSQAQLSCVNTSLSSKHSSSAKGTSSSHRWRGMPTANINETMTEEEFFEWLQNAMQSGVFETNGGTSNDNLAGRSGSSSKSSSVKKKEDREEAMVKIEFSSFGEA